jgi:hypothetical protein
MKKIEKIIKGFIATLLGLIQMILVTLGCLYIGTLWGETILLAQTISNFGPIIGLISLAWPGYILIRMDTPINNLNPDTKK